MAALRNHYVSSFTDKMDENVWRDKTHGGIWWYQDTIWKAAAAIDDDEEDDDVLIYRRLVFLVV